jgi:hypothetical protein
MSHNLRERPSIAAARSVSCTVRTFLQLRPSIIPSVHVTALKGDDLLLTAWLSSRNGPPTIPPNRRPEHPITWVGVTDDTTMWNSPRSFGAGRIPD